MSQEALTVCGGCRRHVRITDAMCPFCSSVLLPIHKTQSRIHRTWDAKNGEFVSATATRMSRAAMLIASMAAVSCKESGSIAAVYGAPVAVPNPVVPDAGPAAESTDAAPADAPADAAPYATPAPMYGGPPIR